MGTKCICSYLLETLSLRLSKCKKRLPTAEKTTSKRAIWTQIFLLKSCWERWTSSKTLCRYSHVSICWTGIIFYQHKWWVVQHESQQKTNKYDWLSRYENTSLSEFEENIWRPKTSFSKSANFLDRESSKFLGKCSSTASDRFIRDFFAVQWNVFSKTRCNSRCIEIISSW